MRLATIRTTTGLQAVRVDQDSATEIGSPDVGILLEDSNWKTRAAQASGPEHALDSLDFATLIPKPEKVICIGLNYRNHILEMGRELPEHPTVFAKYHRALIGANDPISLPVESSAMDWEAELGVIIGSPIRRGSRDDAAKAIAGYTVVNDITARDFQTRTLQWLQGKTFEATTPVGPFLVTDIEPPASDMTCVVDGDVVQSTNTGDLVFDPLDLVSYLSTIITLVPGDIIATGTPGGVGHARKPPRYLGAGSTVVTSIAGLGECTNLCVQEG